MVVDSCDYVHIVIPVYNSENYLSRCIDSCINQSYKKIDILCVDDGSVDSSNEILLDYSRKYKNINIFTETNKGPSAARNVAINILKKYKGFLVFIDSDDYICPDYIERFIKAYGDSGGKADLIIDSFNDDIGHCTKQKCLKKIVEYTISRGPYKKMIKSNIYSTLSFDESISYGEDLIYTFDVISQSSFIYLIKNGGYMTIPNPNSLTRKPLSYKRLFDDSYSWFIVYKKLSAVSFYDDDDLVYKYTHAISVAFLELYSISKKDKKKYRYLDYLEYKKFVSNNRVISLYKPKDFVGKTKKFIYLYFRFAYKPVHFVKALFCMR